MGRYYGIVEVAVAAVISGGKRGLRLDEEACTNGT